MDIFSEKLQKHVVKIVERTTTTPKQISWESLCNSIVSETELSINVSDDCMNTFLKNEKKNSTLRKRLSLFPNLNETMNPVSKASFQPLLQ